MSEKLPANNFEWMKVIFSFNEDFIKHCNKESNEGYLLEIYVHCLEKLFELHNDLSFLAERIKIEKVENLLTTNLTTRPLGDVITMSQRHCRSLTNETPNDVSVERHQDLCMVHIHGVLLERRDEVLRRRNNDVPSVRVHNVSNKSQMKHPTMSQWNVTKTSHWYASTTPHYCVSTTSPVSPK